ncbi:hypothetical protein Y1Q_0011331 [Alligator mississippiensis]|uniref:Uncharacterized protein n=1 Tax=Alligator mississippiensis TaxID=8496 RepID=A0A151N877_ALLMI|nr:hypothetical protein Y1Q_0011331 [Alligator mississippiensis]
MASEDQLVETWVWQVEDITQQDVWQEEGVAHDDRWDQSNEAGDWADWEFRVQLLTLEEQCMEALVLMARVLEAMEEDHQVLDTVLALMVIFMLPTDLPPTAAPLPPGSHPPPGIRPPCGPGKRSSTISLGEKPLAWFLPWVLCHSAPQPGPSPTTHPGLMQPQSRSCLQQFQDCALVLLVLATHSPGAIRPLSDSHTHNHSTCK